ncbi:Transcriptional regulator [Nostocoides japonicum T1-X7]|uniref:Transcriptional regulator n=1 Tax=Nostocoides japonicum T1-X7 TaxID=1194083 RepID=A0A077LVG5_9MICO|nr:MurR/RpiR family transcriptional regulator [Tetrasphaera japonica]CCH75999.1 Transcriptional regulator [Tetrasphaera japonica T1-X7]
MSQPSSVNVDSLLAARVARVKLGVQGDRVVQLVAQMPQFSSYASAREVAERAGVNVSTVVRTAQQLDYSGWPDLRSAIRAAYLDSLRSAGAERAPDDDASARMLRKDGENLTVASAPENLTAIKSAASAISSARRVVVIASGTGAGPGHIFSYLGSIYGYDVRLAAGPATEQAAAIAHLDDDDCVVVLNIWRLTRATRGLTRLARQRGATVVVVTDLQSSPLNSDADHIVLAPIEGISGTPSLTGVVAVMQSILAELETSQTRKSIADVEQAWEGMHLMNN